DRPPAVLARLRSGPRALPLHLPWFPAVPLRGARLRAALPVAARRRRVPPGPDARRRDQLRDPLPLQLRRVLAVGLPRGNDADDHDRRLLLGHGRAAALLPALAARALLRAPVRVDHPDADRPLARQATRPRTGRILALQAFWALVLLGIGRVVLARGTRKL